jgi:hypothetical protein
MPTNSRIFDRASAFRLRPCADLQIRPEIREDHANYNHNWLQVLKDDKRAVCAAASHASKAVEFPHGLQPNWIVRWREGLSLELQACKRHRLRPSSLHTESCLRTLAPIAPI